MLAASGCGFTGIYDVPLPARREQDMKHAPPFLAMKKQILARIRDTKALDDETAASLKSALGEFGKQFA